MEHLAIRVTAELDVVVVEQHLDADGALDQRQLLVEQAAGEDAQVGAQTLLAFAFRRGKGALLGPDPAPQVQGVAAQHQHREQTDQQYSDR
ncbi:hypothetical protein D3C84_399330 [compost metagenome]